LKKGFAKTTIKTKQQKLKAATPVFPFVKQKVNPKKKKRR
jgi:hypothetical protein